MGFRALVAATLACLMTGAVAGVFMLEVITLVVFCVFSLVYLKEGLKWNYIVGFLMMILAVFFIFKKW